MEWYYIGHYGQLGPLTKEQMEELVEGGVILPETYVWRTGMTEWQTAGMVAELRTALQAAAPFAAPPPPPVFHEARPPAAQPAPQPFQAPRPQPYAQPPQPYGYGFMTYGARSDKSRALAGILQFILPGVGRMYLGYYAQGVIQLVLTLCTGVLYVWPFVDGIIILTGGVKFDGFGRVLGE